MDTEKIKIKMKKILPKKIYLIGLRLWRTLAPIIYRSNLKKLRKFDRPFYKKVNVKGKEFYLLIDPKNGLFDKTIYLSDAYEEETTNLILSKINKDDVFLDIGSNIGYFSNLLPQYCKKVIAFEPIKRAYSQNKKSIEKNGYKNIELHNVACGRASGKGTININNKNLGGSSLIKEKLIEDGRRLGETESVEIIGIDNFLKNKKLKIGFVKIDTEGFEWEVLQGMEELLKRDKPKMVVEFLPTLHNKINPEIPKRMIRFLENIGYKIYDMKARRNIDSNMKFNEDCDLYCVIK